MKPIYPPLLPGGFQPIGPWQLDQQFLDPFPVIETKRRKRLLIRFRRFLDDLAKLNVPLELWIGGSFTTLDPEPDAVDVVVWVAQADAERLASKRLRLFERLLRVTQHEWVKVTYEVSAFLADPESVADHEYWAKKLGADPGNLYRKGIFRLTVNQHSTQPTQPGRA